MSGAAFQMDSSLWGSSGAFGSSPFGTSPFGGSDYEALQLPTYHLGSDDLTRTLHREATDIVHYRGRQPVSVRKFASWSAWRVNFSVITAQQLEVLKTFWEARVFRLRPNIDSEANYLVHWADQDFSPEHIGNGKYSLSFEIREVAQ